MGRWLLVFNSPGAHEKKQQKTPHAYSSFGYLAWVLRSLSFLGPETNDLVTATLDKEEARMALEAEAHH